MVFSRDTSAGRHDLNPQSAKGGPIGLNLTPACWAQRFYKMERNPAAF